MTPSLWGSEQSCSRCRGLRNALQYFRVTIGGEEVIVAQWQDWHPRAGIPPRTVPTITLKVLFVFM